MAETATRTGVDMAPWGPGVIHYQTSGGMYLAVSVDVGPDARAVALISETAQSAGGTIHTFVDEPTVIMECGEHGEAITLDRLREFPPGTSHVDALRWAGYEVA